MCKLQVPVTSCGEENLPAAIGSDPHYPNESILVHEFGHTVTLQASRLHLGGSSRLYLRLYLGCISR